MNYDDTDATILLQFSKTFMINSSYCVTNN